MYTVFRGTKLYTMYTVFRGTIVVFKIFKQRDLFTGLTVKGAKGTVVNRGLLSLLGGSFEIALTVPLSGET